MANGLSPTVVRQLVATWPALAPEARELVLLVLRSFLPADTTLFRQLSDGAGPAASAVAESAATEAQANTLADDARRQRRLTAYALQTPYTPPPRGAWRHSAGIFADDPLAASVFEEVLQARQAERPAE